MNFRTIAWAFDQEVFSSTQKFILVILASYASDKGKSYPAVQTICEMTMCNDKTVRRALKALVAQGVIVDTTKRYGPTGQVKVYGFPPEAWQRLPKMGSFKNPKDPRKTPERPPKDPRKVPNFGYQSVELLNIELTKREASPMRQLTDAWKVSYKEFYGVEYNFQGGHDGKAAMKLLKLGVSTSNVMETAKLAWTQQNPKTHWNCVNRSATLCGFEAAFSSIVAELKKHHTNGHTRTAAEDAELRELYPVAEDEDRF